MADDGEVEPDLEADLLAKAARGDLHALRTLTLYTFAGDTADTPAGEVLAQAEIFARLAAQVGGPSENGLLLEVIWQRALLLADCAPLRAGELAQQAAMILEALERSADGRIAAAVPLTGLADAGDESAAVRLNELFEGVGASEAISIRAAVNECVRDGGELVGILRAAREGSGS